uniref:Uncharacterized protein n=1 Tax=Anguilla anguilla TaxID=7936 RepID=A0A0E9PGF9_ANGAN
MVQLNESKNLFSTELPLNK